MIRLIRCLLFTLMISTAPLQGNARAQSNAGAPDDIVETIFGSLVQGGKLQLNYPSDLPSPAIGDFRKIKLGCKKAISSRDGDLATDVSGFFSGIPEPFRIYRGQYVTGWDCMFKYCSNKVLMVFDKANQWSAFALIHANDYWNYEDGDPRLDWIKAPDGTGYSRPHFSLFLVDDSSSQFDAFAEQKAREWMYGFSWSGGKVTKYEDERYYEDDLPLKTYKFNCQTEN